MEISDLSIGGKKMKYKKFENTIIARIDKGEDIVEQVKNIALKENIKLASIQALGAINDFTVGVFKTKEKKYYANEFKGDYEIVSLTGTINTMMNIIVICIYLLEMIKEKFLVVI